MRSTPSRDGTDVAGTDTDPTVLEVEDRSDRPEPGAPVLEVRDLRVQFPTEDGLVTAVDGVSFTVDANETLGIVGESGSGKSVTSLAILGLLPKSAQITGEVRFRGEQILGLSERKMQPIRGRRIAMVFQDALAALPGLAITLLVVACNLLGDGLRDALDPRTRLAAAGVT